MKTSPKFLPRIERAFARTKAAGRAAFIAYIAAGDPDYDRCLQVVDTLADAGVDLLELGVPFSDPLADGETNQVAAQRALAAGMTVSRCLDLVRDIRRRHPELPLIFYTYLNPVVYARDFATFCAEAAAAGLDALLPLDLTPGESPELEQVIAQSPLGLVTLATPLTDDQRLETIARKATAFIYYVSREGVTGERQDIAPDVEQNLRRVRARSALPIVVGFGVSTPAQAGVIARGAADGVVIGSAIVKRVEAFGKNARALEDLSVFAKAVSDALQRNG